MLEHDQILWNNCATAGLIKIVSGRYVDDENPVLKPVPFGSRLINGIIQIDQTCVESDKLIPHDRRTFNIVQQIANLIWPNIQFTVDVPSECQSGLIPMLDMEVGINQLGMITRKFYCKPMNTPFTILSRSAHLWQIKRSTLTQEGVRRLLNTSVEAPGHVKDQILSEWDLKMNRSGYDQTFRSNVIKSAVEIYTHKVSVAKSGGRPLYRPTGWHSTERDLSKLVKKQTWYSGTGQQRNHAPLILDPTPTGQLEKDIANIIKEAARLTGLRVKLCQRGGSKVVSSAKSDPFASILCDRSSCPICRTPESKGGCKHSNVGYQLFCIQCSNLGIVASYQGETSKSGFERGNQHSEGLLKKSEDAPLWKHAEMYHNSDTKLQFGMEVTGRFKKAFERQENEAIRIRESSALYQMNSHREFHQPTIVRMIPVSNTLQSDQSGSNNQVMYYSSHNTNRSHQQSRVDSPTVQPRSKPRVQSPSSNLQTVTTTRRQRMDLDMSKAISRSVMKYHPSIVENRELDRSNYRSPSVNSSKHSKKYKSKPTHTRERSMSPLQEHTRSHKSPGKHVSRKRQHSNEPTRHHIPMSPLPLHNHTSKSPSKHVSSKTKHSSRRTRQLKTSSASHTTPKKHNNKHHNHTPLPNTSPISQNTFSFAMRKLSGVRQSDKQLSLSPVSQTNLTQYTKPHVISPNSSTHNTVILEEISSNSDVSSYSATKVSPHTRAPRVNLNKAFTSDIPNVFKCTKDPSITKGEKSKNHNTNTVSSTSSDDIPIIQQYLSTDSLSADDIASISDEFNNSWGSDMIETSGQATPPNVTNVTLMPKTTITPNTTSRFSTPPQILAAQVLYAVKNPITCPIKDRQLRAIRLQKVQILKSKNSKNKFNSQLNNFKVTFQNQPTPKKRTPRKTTKNISYYEG